MKGEQERSRGIPKPAYEAIAAHDGHLAYVVDDVVNHAHDVFDRALKRLGELNSLTAHQVTELSPENREAHHNERIACLEVLYQLQMIGVGQGWYGGPIRE